MSDVNEWSEQYTQAINSPPQEGDILEVLNDEEARLDIDLKPGQSPFAYARAYVPNEVNGRVGWFLQPISCETPHGLKCILIPKAREAIFKEKGIHLILGIKSLKVVKWTGTGKAILCDIEEM